MGDEEIVVIVLELPSSEIKNWDDFEKLVHHAVYNEARVAPEEHPFIISESTFANSATREKITQIMFETFNVPGLSILPTSVLVVNAAGIQTGLSLHFGETSAEFVPVVNGIPLREIAMDFPITGGYTSGYLDSFISKKVKESYKPATIREAKTKTFVSQNPASQSTTEVKFTLGEEEIDLADYAWKTPEVVFYPEMVGIDHEPLVISILQLISLCPLVIIFDEEKESQRELLENIVISGGNANFDGFASRLKHDLEFLLHGQEYKVGVKKAGEITGLTAWLGGSIIGSLSDFYSSKYCQMDLYNEHGPSVIHSFVP